MSLKIVEYPHPTLRHKSKPIQRVDAELHTIVARMFELMYEAKGIGLAANQVALPIRLFVTNPSGVKGEGEEFVFINPVLSRPKGNEEKEEGCLSLPGLYAPVRRPQRIQVSAYNLKGEEFEGELDGLFARVVQHETDHLDGILFIDRLSDTEALNLRPELNEMIAVYEEQLAENHRPTLEQVQSEVAEWELRYC
jgi:peptide deformylase